MSDRTIFVATDSVLGEYEGRPLHIFRGVTTVRAGHPLLEKFADRFTPLQPMFEVEPEPESDAEDGPPQPEDAPPAAPVQAEAPEAPATAQPDPKAVRAWAADQGIDVPARGKLSEAVVAQYRAAHPEA